MSLAKSSPVVLWSAYSGALTSRIWPELAWEAMMRDFFTLLFSLLFWPAICINLDNGFNQLTGGVDLLRGYWAAEYRLQQEALREALRCNLEDAAAYLKQEAPRQGGAIDDALSGLRQRLKDAPRATGDTSPLMRLSSASYRQKNRLLDPLYPNWYYRFVGGGSGG